MTGNRLAAILGGTVSAAAAPTATNTLPVDALRPGTGQPRRHFDEQALKELAHSIAEKGVLQPLLVRPVDGGYEIVAGERRWRAAQLAGLRDVPVLIRALTDEEARAAALLENIQRKALSPLEEIEGKLAVTAAALGLPDAEAMTAMQAARVEPGGEVARQLDQVFAAFGGESWQSYASNKLAVFAWHPNILDAMRRALEFTKAKLIQSAPEDARTDLLALALRGASRTELQAEIKRAQKPKKKAVLREDRLRAALGKRKVITKMAPEKRSRFDELADELLALLEAE